MGLDKINAGPYRQKRSRLRSVLTRSIWLFPIALLLYLTLTLHPPEIPVHIANFDKAEHFTAFVLLCLWYFKSPQRPGQMLRVSAVLLAIGIAIEYVQGMIGRDFEYGDMLADGVGILTGLILYRLTPISVAINRIKSALGLRPSSF